MTRINVTVDGMACSDDVEPRMLLVHYLREVVGKVGTVVGCDTSNCGTCVVWVDSEPVKSCTMLAAMAGGHDVRTVEGMEVDGVLDPVQEGFIQCHGLQCGYCTPGMIMTTVDLLRRNPNPTEHEIREGLEGNICRCTGYQNIVRAVAEAALALREAPAASASA